ncbi:MAG: DUF2087 domain-containing protein [Trebonia sp.]
MDTTRGTVLSSPPDQLKPFIREGRISVMPAKRTTRLILLNEVAQAFEPGRHYSEAEINEVLKALIADHAALRRHLVDEGLMDRTGDGTYWRSGGTAIFGD